VLARFKIMDREHLYRRLQLFHDAAFQFAIFVSTQELKSQHVCLIPAWGPMFIELQSWPGARFIGVYDQCAKLEDIVDDVQMDAYWLRDKGTRGDKVHYHRYKHSGKVVARNYLRRKKK
jgi:hypothetical protein